MPRWVMCQSSATPSLALYWHIGETAMRLASWRSASFIGEKRALVMTDHMWGGFLRYNFACLKAALVRYGDPFDWIFAGLLAPFFLGIKLVADRLRLALLDAVIASRNMSLLADDMSLLARQFDVALNNMPHGLCMLDSNRRILVSNKKLREQLELQPAYELKGSSWRRLMENLVEGGLISDVNGQSLIDRLENVLSAGSSFVVDLQHGRSLGVNLQHMENGGVVIVTEDITERRIAEDRINRLARFDALTGLPNRITFRDCMERAVTQWPPGNMAPFTLLTWINSSRST